MSHVNLDREGWFYVAPPFNRSGRQRQVVAHAPRPDSRCISGLFPNRRRRLDAARFSRHHHDVGARDGCGRPIAVTRCHAPRARRVCQGTGVNPT